MKKFFAFNSNIKNIKLCKKINELNQLRTFSKLEKYALKEDW